MAEPAGSVRARSVELMRRRKDPNYVPAERDASASPSPSFRGGSAAAATKALLTRRSADGFRSPNRASPSDVFAGARRSLAAQALPSGRTRLTRPHFALGDLHDRIARARGVIDAAEHTNSSAFGRGRSPERDGGVTVDSESREGSDYRSASPPSPRAMATIPPQRDEPTSPVDYLDGSGLAARARSLAEHRTTPPRDRSERRRAGGGSKDEGGTFGQEVVAVLDADGDGGVDEAELRAGIAAGKMSSALGTKEDAGRTAREVFDRFDENGDGVLDEDELEQMAQMVATERSLDGSPAEWHRGKDAAFNVHARARPARDDSNERRIMAEKARQAREELAELNEEIEEVAAAVGGPLEMPTRRFEKDGRSLHSQAEALNDELTNSSAWTAPVPAPSSWETSPRQRPKARLSRAQSPGKALLSRMQGLVVSRATPGGTASPRPGSPARSPSRSPSRSRAAGGGYGPVVVDISAAGWQQVLPVDGVGDSYYWHRPTDTVRWDRPSAKESMPVVPSADNPALASADADTPATPGGEGTSQTSTPANSLFLSTILHLLSSSICCQSCGSPFLCRSDVLPAASRCSVDAVNSRGGPGREDPHRPAAPAPATHLPLRRPIRPRLRARSPVTHRPRRGPAAGLAPTIAAALRLRRPRSDRRGRRLPGPAGGFTSPALRQPGTPAPPRAWQPGGLADGGGARGFEFALRCRGVCGAAAGALAWTGRPFRESRPLSPCPAPSVSSSCLCVLRLTCGVCAQSLPPASPGRATSRGDGGPGTPLTHRSSSRVRSRSAQPSASATSLPLRAFPDLCRAATLRSF